MIEIKIRREFTATPGARFKTDGNFSGEQFREEILEPKFKEAIEKKEKLFIDLDGGYGYAQSFLEESFGGLARMYGVKEVEDSIERIKSEDEPRLIEDIQQYIRNAKNKK